MTLWVEVTQGKSSSCLVCGHKHCGSGDTMFLVCHVISLDHMTKGWSNIMGGSRSWQVTSLPSLVGSHRHCEWRYNEFRLSRDFKRPHNRRVKLLYGRELMSISYLPAKFGGHRHYDS